MFELKIISQFAAAHQLEGYEGGCEQLHGHNWKVEVFVSGDQLGDDGLLVDFKVIKKATEKALKELDHQFLNELDLFKDTNPSSENIARYIFDFVGRELHESPVGVSKVTAWESDTACATYLKPHSQ